MELFLLGLLLLVAAVVGLVMLGRSRVRRQQQADEAVLSNVEEDPFKQQFWIDPRQLKMGDLFEYAGRSLAVRGTVSYEEGGESWLEHHLQTADGSRTWLSLEDVGGDLEAILWTEVWGSALAPDGQTVVYEGVTYRRKEWGTASFVSRGATGMLPAGQVEYADYEAEGGRYLAFERCDRKWEVSTGERVDLNIVNIYPGAAY